MRGTFNAACAAFALLAGTIGPVRPIYAQTPRQDEATIAKQLPATIPIFPLEEPMLFPGAPRRLHIFEPRYRAMVADALKGSRIIGMVTLRPGYEADYHGRPPIFTIGCAGTITDVEELPDGRYNIELRGLVKFRVTSEDNSRPYRLASIVGIPEVPTPSEQTALRGERQKLDDVLSLAPDHFGFQPPPLGVPDADAVNIMSQYVEINPLDRQDLLEQEGILTRARALIALLQTMQQR